MTSHSDNSSEISQAEETLRLIARLPAPAGLESRIHAALHAASQSHSNAAFREPHGRVVAWPSALRSQSSWARSHGEWMRSAAAAAIVFVVAGGGWGVYTRVERNLPGKVIVMPARIAAPSGFSGASAVRTPQTLAGPTVSQSAIPKPGKKSPPRTASAQTGALPATLPPDSAK
jgi:hypothetical protein